MIALPQPDWIRAAAKGLAALPARCGAGLSGFRAAWRDTAALVRNRQLVVATPPGPEAVLLTRVRLTGETETCALRAWLERTPPSEVEATAEKHFADVRSAIRGWPAALGMVRLGSRVAVIGGAIFALEQATRWLLDPKAMPLLHAILPAILHGASAAWPLSAGLVLLAAGLIGRPILRSWLRAQIRHVPLRIPSSP